MFLFWFRGFDQNFTIILYCLVLDFFNFAALNFDQYFLFLPADFQSLSLFVLVCVVRCVHVRARPEVC